MIDLVAYNMLDVKVILWDLGNVFIQGIHGPLFDLLCVKNNSTLDKESFNKGMYEIINNSFYGRIGLEDTWKLLQVHADIDDKSFMNIRSSVVKNNFNQGLIQEVMELKKRFTFGILSDLSQIGYSVVQNNIAHFTRQCEPKCVFISIFHGLTKLKDGHTFFNLALEKMNVSAHHVLLIDDSKKSIEKAKFLGMKGVIYQHAENDPAWETANATLKNDLAKLGIRV